MIIESYSTVAKLSQYLGMCVFKTFVTCNCVNWDRSSHFPRPTERSDHFGLFLLVSPSGYIISPFSTNFQGLPLQKSSLDIFCDTPNYFVFSTAYSRNSRWKMFIYLICNTISNETTVIFTCCLALNNKIVWIYTITNNLVSSNNTTLPMSKEVDIVVFLKSNNNESHVPSKKTILCSFIYKVSFKKTWGGKKWVFSCKRIP